MNVQSVVWGEALPPWLRGLVVLSCLVYLAVTALEVIRRDSGATGPVRWVLPSALGAVVLLALAVLRPASVSDRVSSLGAKVVVLVDQGRHMELGAGGSTRAERAHDAVRSLKHAWPGLRIEQFGFLSGSLRAWPSREVGQSFSDESEQSDVLAALEALARRSDEKPAAVVIISDGVWSRPDVEAGAQSYALSGTLAGTAVHTVDVGGAPLNDASVLEVRSVGSAIAHQPLALDVSIYCAKGLSCDKVPVVVREHLKGSSPQVLTRAEAAFRGERVARVSLEITIERAGSRIVEVSIEAPAGDQVAENNRRFLTLEVLRDRLRLLHVAGRPTYDVRALRQWLKSDSSVDLVSFFILRTDGDEPGVSDESELALIPFPVDELFTEHLPSFDAVVLEDIDAERYRIAPHLENLAQYVERGGGLIVVGGPSAFGGGGYAHSPLERVLPVALRESQQTFDTVEFVPRVTEAGRGARLLDPLRALLDEELPMMPGANTLGPAKPKAVVLWEHPSRTALPLKTGGAPLAMPVLAVGEVGDGRVVALAVDGTHRLAWGSVGLRTAGRAYGALWDGLLGWVMREPRFDAVRAALAGECIVGRPATVRVSLASVYRGPVALEIARLDAATSKVFSAALEANGEKTVAFTLEPLTEGAYSAELRLGREPAARFDFACERGGRGWSDPRTYPERLERLAQANGGVRVPSESASSLPRPSVSPVTTFRQTTPWAASWVWSLAAALALAAHWLLRRLSGLS